MTRPPYTEKDLKKVKDTISFIQSHADRYLPSGVDLGHFLAARMVFDLVFLDCTPSTVRMENNWWIVEGNKDWIEPPNKAEIQRVFSQIVPLPAAGQNSFRSEVLICAFSEVVVTSDTHNGALFLKGGAEESFIRSFLQSFQMPKSRSVAFLVNNLPR